MKTNEPHLDPVARTGLKANLRYFVGMGWKSPELLVRFGKWLACWPDTYLAKFLARVAKADIRWMEEVADVLCRRYRLIAPVIRIFFWRKFEDTANQAS